MLSDFCRSVPRLQDTMPGAKRQSPAKSNMTAREMWLQAVKGRAAHHGDNRKSGLSTTKKTPNEYWVGTLRRSQGESMVCKYVSCSF